jgi:DNA-binding NarL/FixJ family response regulator
MPRTCAILIAESNLLLRKKGADVLTRHPHVWCVVQVNDMAGLMRGAADLDPDIIVADLNIFTEQGWKPTRILSCEAERKAAGIFSFLVSPGDGGSTEKGTKR